MQRTTPAQSFDIFMSFTEWARDLGFRPGQLSIETSRHPASEDIARELNVAPDSPVVTITRLRLLDDQPAMLERSTFPYEIGQHLLPAGVDTGSLYQALRSHGIVPMRARHVIDAVGAGSLEAKYLGVETGTPLLRARRVSTSEHGAVIESADDQYLPSMASFVVENSAAQRTPLLREAGEATRDPLAAGAGRLSHN
ncbi:GntR family transcriptional regulator [Leucobacter coleopterorum]|uniref:GntR family transcriptional regulator n=1 Tax=Leucobacter coleopterorum TaxID=2714933 RepID=UPI001FCB52D4|nr:GntR family transcriptional regulator [Leucobacter coleopterorum]